LQQFSAKGLPVIHERFFSEYTGAMKKILVVDDEENIRLLYKEELEDQGYQVTIAASAEEAKAKIREDKPDVITLDIKMPGMDGIEFIEKSKEERNNIPVILCSAHGRFKQEFRVWASGAFVVKSADLSELKLTIKEVLNEVASQ
jgi:DNA-binding response OmpR family regulator